ncbi:MAG: fasciclin domain-containing protein, partial [Mycobacteriaceae bacterium]|nr:fasciclin domain-containing protein [Mycobacteriaceae bacterium]
MQHLHYTRVAVAGLSAAALIGLTACSSSAMSSPGSTSATAGNPAPMASTMAPASAVPAANLVGTGCTSYAQQVPTGPGSVQGMAQDPVAVAASNNPMLTTLTAALSGKLNPNVNLVDTLNNGQYTVFAPTDDAFKKLPQSTIDTLKTDAALLTKILTYHVVQGQLSPDQVVGT